MNKPLLRLLAAVFLMTPPLAAVAADASPVLDPDAAKPPVTERKPKVVGLHGDKIEDPYFWLREKTNPAVIDHLKAENTYTAAVMAPFKPFEDSLYKEMLGRIKQTDVSAPYFQRGYWLYQRTEEGKQYRVLCRKKGTLDAAEEVVLDVNKLSEGQKFMALGTFDYSDDNALLAYSTDVNGHRDYDFHLKKLATGEEIKTPIGKVADVAWAADSQTIFYVTEDESKRSYRLYRYTLGEKDPTLLFEEKDELFDVGIERSHDGKYLFAGSGSKRTSEFRYLAADQPKGEFKVIAPRREEVEYYPEHKDGLFYLRTNDGAKEYRVVTAPVTSPGVEHWKEHLPGHDGLKIEDFQPFEKFAVVYEREGGLTQLRVLDYAAPTAGKLIQLPEQAYDVSPGENPEFGANAYRFDYQSPVTPPSVYDYDVAKGRGCSSSRPRCSAVTTRRNTWLSGRK